MNVENLTIPRVMLHARVLGIIHPETGKALEFSAPLPEDMAHVLTGLKRMAER